jgi:hypothetical protein
VQRGGACYKDIVASAARPSGDTDAAWKIMIAAKMPQLAPLGCKGETHHIAASAARLLGGTDAARRLCLHQAALATMSNSRVKAIL